MGQMGAVQRIATFRFLFLTVVPNWLGAALLLPCFLFVLLLTVITPPLEVPDEMQHFYRAYQISQPAASGRVQDGMAGADLPASLSNMTQHFLGTKAIHAPRLPHAHYWRDSAAYLDAPLRPAQREFTNFGSQIIYSPLGYLPQSAGVAIGRVSQLGPLSLLYVARLANALVGLGIIACAIRLLPSGRAMIAAVAFLPMSAYEIASASADGQVIPFAILYTVLAIRGLQAGSWTPREVGAALIAGLVVTTVKLPYLPLVGLGLPALLRKPRRKSTIAFAIGVPVICGLASLAWLHYVAPLVVITRPDLPPSNVVQQVSYLRENPFTIVGIVLHTLVQWQFLLWSMIGNFGWLNSPLPTIGIVIGIASLACATICCSRLNLRFSGLIAAWSLTLFAAVIVLTCVALYLTWTPIGYFRAEGMQGRYLLPMLVAVLFGLSTVSSSNLAVRFSRHIEVICLALVVLNATLTLLVLVRRFHILG